MHQRQAKTGFGHESRFSDTARPGEVVERARFTRPRCAENSEVLSSSEKHAWNRTCFGIKSIYFRVIFLMLFCFDWVLNPYIGHASLVVKSFH